MSDPTVAAPVKAASDSGVNFARPHVLERHAAERPLELFPFADLVKFGVNGEWLEHDQCGGQSGPRVHKQGTHRRARGSCSARDRRLVPLHHTNVCRNPRWRITG
jgi:hypothetical protein